MNDRSQAFVLPDPIVDPSLLSGAVLLYFDPPYLFASPPAVITRESFEMMDLVASRRPPWARRIKEIVGSLLEVNKAARATLDMINELAPGTVLSMYWAYPANEAAFAKVDAWVERSGYSYAELMNVAIPPFGAAELARHLFLERYLELERDCDQLYQYCDTVIGSDDLNSLVVASYLLRLQAILALPADAKLLLTNESLGPFLQAILRNSENEGVPSDTKREPVLEGDVLAWEFFRVLVSRLVDPLSDDRLRQLLRIRSESAEEIQRLKARCREMSSHLDGETSVVNLGQKALNVIERTMRRELRELFELDANAWRDFKDSLAADKVLWTSLAGVLTGLAGSGVTIAAAGVISALASVGTTAVKTRNAREKRLRESDLALLRVLRTRVPQATAAQQHNED